MQHLTFAPASIKTEIPGYDQISNQGSNSCGNIPATNGTDPGSNQTHSLDDISTDLYDIAPSTSLAYLPVSTSTNSDYFNSIFDYLPSRAIDAQGANVLEVPPNLVSKHPDDVKSFVEQTVLLPNPKSPPCYFPAVSGIETVDGIQGSNPMSCTGEGFLNSTFSDCYFQMKLTSEPNRVAPTSFLASYPQVEHVYNYEIDPEGRLRCNWWERHPDTWSLQEVLNWITVTVHQDMVNPTYNCTDGFKDLTSGACLRHMTYEEFLIRDPQYGHLLFNCFRQLLDVHAHASVGPEIRDIPSSQHPGHRDTKVDQFSQYTSYAQTSPSNTFLTTQNGSDHASSYTNLVVPKYPSQHNEIRRGPVVDTSYHSTNTGSSRRVLPTFDQFENPKRKPGRPRLHPCFRSTVAGNKKMKILPLWEFIYSTLQNAQFNPSIIKWEDEAQGKFRFVNSEKFAKLWGSAKNNDNMNYEKLSRAMRHYYGKDIMERVEGRRLVYRFLSPSLERLRKKQDPDVPLSDSHRTLELNRSI